MTSSQSDLSTLRPRGKTKSVTEWGIGAWNDWASSRSSSHEREGTVVDVNTQLVEMPPTDFAYWIRKFTLEVRKADGSENPPKSLYALVCCFKQFFERNGIHGINPLNCEDVRFGILEQRLTQK